MTDIILPVNIHHRIGVKIGRILINKNEEKWANIGNLKKIRTLT